MDSLVVMFFAAALLGSPWLLALLRWKALAFIGMLSYSLFLFHHSVLYLTSIHVLPEIGSRFMPWLTQQGELRVLAAFTMYFGGTLLLCIAISYLSYRYIESPFLRNKPK